MAFVVGDDSRDTRHDTNSEELDALRADLDATDGSAGPAESVAATAEQALITPTSIQCAKSRFQSLLCAA